MKKLSMKKNYKYEIDENIYQRFHEKNEMFIRFLWDKTLKTYQNDFSKGMLKDIGSKKEGYTHIDYAFFKGAYTVHNKFFFAFSWKGDTSLASLDNDWYGGLRESKYKIEDPMGFTDKVKKIARYYGASLVGITKVDEKWIYKTGVSTRSNGNKLVAGSPYPIVFPEKIDTAIVMAIEMESEGLSTTPAIPASAATSLGYSKMAFVISCLGEFIRELGYEAIQSGNDTGLSIPLAIDAGFGALGRNGLLVTPEYGSRVQICKVFTDLPLIPDKPNIEFIEELSSFCRGCYKCADACEVKAISFNSKPNFKVRSFSNNPGVKKYYIDPEKCFEFWIENHSDCSNCITACPFSKVNYPLAPKEFWKNK